MFFGMEPLNLNHPQAYGTLVSYWKEDYKVTKLVGLSYRFAKVCLGVLGKGFGSCPSVPRLGSNSYFKPHGKGTEATTSSPAQADSVNPSSGPRASLGQASMASRYWQLPA